MTTLPRKGASYLQLCVAATDAARAITSVRNALTLGDARMGRPPAAKHALTRTVPSGGCGERHAEAVCAHGQQAHRAADFPCSNRWGLPKKILVGTVTAGRRRRAVSRRARCLRAMRPRRPPAA